MARTLTASEALSYYFSHRTAWARDICWHVSSAARNWGTTQQRHAKNAVQLIAEPLRVADFLLNHLDSLSVDSTVRPAIEADIATLQDYRSLMQKYLRNPWA